MDRKDEVRRRIVDAATRLLYAEGRAGVTTRAVSAAAGVQPPTIYRQFTDMDGLLEAVAADGFERYLTQKHNQTLTDDPVDDLRRGWDLHIGFGLENPAHYLLMFGRPAAGRRSPVAEQALHRLHTLVERVAVAGELAVSQPIAASMMLAAGVGVTLNLIETSPDDRDLSVSERLREATLAAITTSKPTSPPEVSQRAVALKAVLDQVADVYSPGERALLDELLDRAATHQPVRR